MTATFTDIDPVLLDKLDAIQSMIDGATTQGEAEAAAAAMTRLLTKHNLELMDIAARLGKKEEVQKFEGTFENTAGWRVSLMSTIADNHGGRIVYTARHGYDSTWTLFCTRDRKEEILQMYAMFVPIIERLASLAWKQRRQEYLNAGHSRWSIPSGRSWTYSYKQGFSSGLSQAMSDAKKQAVSEYHGGSALVAVEDKAATEAMRAAYPRLRHTSISIGSSEGYKQGREAGHSAMTKGLNG